MKFIHSKTAVRLFFALLLVVAQGQLLVHQTDLEAHAGETSCEFCVHTSHLGSGAIDNARAIVLSPIQATYPRVVDVAPNIAFYYFSPPPRAPPFASLI